MKQRHQECQVLEGPGRDGSGRRTKIFFDFKVVDGVCPGVCPDHKYGTLKNGDE